MHRVDATGHSSNLFVDKDAGLGVAGTRLAADWHNDTQEEICNVVEATGQTLVKGTQNQLLNAIKRMALPGGLAGDWQSRTVTLSLVLRKAATDGSTILYADAGTKYVYSTNYLAGGTTAISESGAASVNYDATSGRWVCIGGVAATSAKAHYGDDLSALTTVTHPSLTTPFEHGGINSDYILAIDGTNAYKYDLTGASWTGPFAIGGGYANSTSNNLYWSEAVGKWYLHHFGGNCYTSADGETWAQDGTLTTYDRVFIDHDGYLYIFGDDGGISNVGYRTDDGSSYTALTLNYNGTLNGNPLGATVFGGGVAVVYDTYFAHFTGTAGTVIAGLQSTYASDSPAWGFVMDNGMACVGTITSDYLARSPALL